PRMPSLADFKVRVLANSRPIDLRGETQIGGGGFPADGYWDESIIIYSARKLNPGQAEIAHEFGHLLGLKHPGPPGTKMEYAADADALMGYGNAMRPAYYEKWRDWFVSSEGPEWVKEAWADTKPDA